MNTLTLTELVTEVGKFFNGPLLEASYANLNTFGFGLMQHAAIPNLKLVFWSSKFQSKILNFTQLRLKPRTSRCSAGLSGCAHPKDCVLKALIVELLFLKCKTSRSLLCCCNKNDSIIVSSYKPLVAVIIKELCFELNSFKGVCVEGGGRFSGNNKAKPIRTCFQLIIGLNLQKLKICINWGLKQKSNQVPSSLEEILPTTEPAPL